MPKINVLVVEDESIVSKDIQHSLKKLGYNIVGSSATAQKAIELAKTERPDIILMDIMLKGEKNGIDAADEIRKSCAIPVIFLTAYADESTLSKAKKAEPYGYILKPFKEIDLHTTIEMAIYKHSREQDIVKQRDLLFSIVENKDNKEQGYVFVKSNNKLVKLKNEDIYYIEALKDYVVIHTLETRYTIHSTMKDIDTKMGKDNFVRVHRSFIVQLSRIATIEYPNLTLENIQKSIPIGGSYRDDLNKRIKLV